MNKSDKWVTIILILSIVMNLFVLMSGFAKHKLLQYISILNAVSGLSLIAWWLIKQLNIQEHYFEFREISVVCIEVLFVILSFYSIFTDVQNNWLKWSQYIIFSIHFLLLLSGMFFMLTFKMTKLY